MSQSPARETFADLCARGEVFGPVPDVAIGRAQDELGVVFPDEYREFLGTFGAAVLPGAEVYGLPDEATNVPPLWSDVVAVTQSLRGINQSGADDRYLVPISEDGAGAFYYLNTRASPSTEIWVVGPGVSKIASHSFYEFFVGLSEGQSSID